jgi:pseudaminic acid synthase
MNTRNTYIIAEMSANHNGNKQIAIDTIKAAKDAGADAIKLQTYTADTITLDSDAPDFQITQGTHWDGQTLYQLYQKAYTPWEWQKDLFDIAQEIGIDCFSSPFDETSVDFLETIGCPIYKIASPEIVDIPLIEKVAKTGKPIIISTGIATLEDIELALETCYELGNRNVTLLKCTTEYPADPADTNLVTMCDMKNRFGVKVGLSDHTMGIEAPMVAVALGAEVIEKHFILDRAIGGEDAHFSLNKEEFTAMVKAIRLTEKMLGKVDYELTEKKKTSRQFAKSLYIAEDMKEGELITRENVRSVRPGFGLHPKYLKEILGKKVNRELKKGERFYLNMLC